MGENEKMRFIEITVLTDRNRVGDNSPENIVEYGKAIINIDDIKVIQTYTPVPEFFLLGVETTKANLFLISEDTKKMLWSKLPQDTE